MGIKYLNRSITMGNIFKFEEVSSRKALESHSCINEIFQVSGNKYFSCSMNNFRVFKMWNDSF